MPEEAGRKLVRALPQSGERRARVEVMSVKHTLRRGELVPGEEAAEEGEGLKGDEPAL